MQTLKDSEIIAKTNKIKIQKIKNKIIGNHRRSSEKYSSNRMDKDCWNERYINSWLFWDKSNKSLECYKK